MSDLPAPITRDELLALIQRYPSIGSENVPDEWIKVAEAYYSMHGLGLLHNILAGVAPVIQAAERERIAADLTRRADDLGELAGDDPRTHDLRLIATTLRNTAWAITHGDEAENLREAGP